MLLLLVPLVGMYLIRSILRSKFQTTIEYADLFVELVVIWMCVVCMVVGLYI